MKIRRVIRFFVSGFLFPMFAIGQHQVTIKLVGLPAYHPENEAIYVAGSFNGWNPSSVQHRIVSLPGCGNCLVLSLPKGRHEFKLTRGSWEKVETGEKGSALENRIIKVEGDTQVSVSVVHWQDHFPKEPIRSTANAQVSIIDTSFFMPQLNRHRRVWIYLPKEYAHSRKKYPVFYFHDGQNVFDQATSGYGEWGVDEALDSLELKHGPSIIVAIDHGQSSRIQEYAPYDMERFGKAEGRQYMEFLVKTLKPYIDRHYRTKTGRDHTFIAGSSMGGLISFYAVLHYPKTFGGAGVFSPAFWVNPEIKNIPPKKAKKVKGRIFFYGGQLEGESMVPDMMHVFGQMRRHSKARLQTIIRAEGKHNEAAWRKEFPEFYRMMMGKKGEGE